jgi:hypothetical protein
MESAVMEEFNKEINEDIDEDGELDVEWYPIPEGLREAWNEIILEEGKGKQ